MTGPAAGHPLLAGDQRPLQGLRVIELSSFVATPLGGMTLAQLGADVIRIDPPHGAADRQRWPVTEDGQSLYWAGLNKGKRSVVIDSRTAQGAELVAQLISAPGNGAGIVLTNISGRAAPSYDELVRRRPDLVHVHLTGHHDGRTAVDYTVNASSGFALVTGPEPHAEPVNHVLPAWDVACGLYLAVAILGAERARRLTGRPQRVQLALHDVALATADNLGFLAEAQVNRVRRPKVGNNVYGTYGRAFPTGDERHVMVVALTRRHWADLVAMTGTQAPVEAVERALAADFSQESERYRHREVLGALLAPWFAARGTAEIEEALAGTSLLWSRFRSFLEVVDDGDLAGNPIVGAVEQPGIGRYLATGSPLRFADQDLPAAPAPALGADTEDVLTELLGLGQQDLLRLHRDGVLNTPQAQRLTVS